MQADTVLFAATGLEHPSETAEKQGISAERGTESGTLGGDSASNRQPAQAQAAAFPPDLADVAKAWLDLPAAVKAGILAMVKAAVKG